MIIIMPVTTNSSTASINSTLGRSPFFLSFNTETKEKKYISNTAKDAKGGAGIKAAQLLLDQNIDVLITPRSGTNALDVLKEANVSIFESNGFDIEENIRLLSSNQLLPLTEGHAGFHHA